MRRIVRALELRAGRRPRRAHDQVVAQVRVLHTVERSIESGPAFWMSGTGIVIVDRRRGREEHPRRRPARGRPSVVILLILCIHVASIAQTCSVTARRASWR